MFYKKITVVLLVSLLLVSGCAYFRKPPPTFKYISWKKRQVVQRQIKDWQLAGVFSITHKKHRDIASFDWRQRRDSYTINISGPMHINSVRIEGDSERVALWRSDEESIEAETPEQLLHSQLGWKLPISHLRYWILGVPDPAKKVNYKYFDRYGHLNFFKQGGWQVKYSQFQIGVKRGMDLPNVIELRNKDIKIKIKIKKYDLD